jgi:hypothetical protein
MAMPSRRTWGLVRRVYFGAGLLLVVGAVLSFVDPNGFSPWLASLVAALVLGTAVLASDELLAYVHQIFWHRQWPK